MHDEEERTHPVESAVTDKNVREVFDAISYGKGASVLRQISKFIGLDALWKGIQTLMQQYQYKAIDTEDFWKILSQVSNSPVHEIMDSWIKMPSHPVLVLSETNDPFKILITQHLMKHVPNVPMNQEKLVYKVPLLVKNEIDPVAAMIISSNSHMLQLNPHSKWTLLNYGHTGFFRVSYTKNMLASIASAIQQKLVPDEDCLGLVMDVRYWFY